MGAMKMIMLSFTCVSSGNSDDAIQKYTEAITQYNEGLAADADQSQEWF